MSTDRNDDLWNDIDRGLRDGSDTSARDMLAAGVAIYYREADTPEGCLIKHHPDGRRELVRHEMGIDHVLETL